MNTVRFMGWILGLVLATSSAAYAADTSTVVSQIEADAQQVRSDAQEIRRLLDTKSPDFAVIQQRMSALESKADALKKSIADFEAVGTSLTPSQQAAFARAKAATDTLRVLLANKAAALTDTSAASRRRKMLRDQADTIAKRAAIVYEEIGRVRG